MTGASGSIEPFEAPSACDEADVRQTIDDYYGGWFAGDAGRMADALHPDLAKRGWIRDSAGEPAIDPDTRDSMVEWTRRGQGRSHPPAMRACEIQVVEVYVDIATAIVHAALYVESLHLVRTADGWRILNVVWRPPRGG